jgi:copper chaperone CopZ
MKSLTLFSFILFSFFGFSSAEAQTKEKTTIKVWGNCGMCKKTIEAAAKDAGAKKANWSPETKLLQVTYSSAKTNTDKIQQAIAQSGYDTQGFTAPDEVYNQLHGCCKYERKAVTGNVPATPKASCCDKEKCGKDEAACKGAGCCKDKHCCKS